MITGCHFWRITILRPLLFIWTPRLLRFRLSVGSPPPFIKTSRPIIWNWRVFFLNFSCNTTSVSSFIARAELVQDLWPGVHLALPHLFNMKNPDWLGLKRSFIKHRYSRCDKLLNLWLMYKIVNVYFYIFTSILRYYCLYSIVFLFHLTRIKKIFMYWKQLTS